MNNLNCVQYSKVATTFGRLPLIPVNNCVIQCSMSQFLVCMRTLTYKNLQEYNYFEVEIVAVIIVDATRIATSQKN